MALLGPPIRRGQEVRLLGEHDTPTDRLGRRGVSDSVRERGKHAPEPTEGIPWKTMPALRVAQQTKHRAQARTFHHRLSLSAFEGPFAQRRRRVTVYFAQLPGRKARPEDHTHPGSRTPSLPRPVARPSLGGHRPLRALPADVHRTRPHASANPEWPNPSLMALLEFVSIGRELGRLVHRNHRTPRAMPGGPLDGLNASITIEVYASTPLRFRSSNLMERAIWPSLGNHALK